MRKIYARTAVLVPMLSIVSTPVLADLIDTDRFGYSGTITRYDTLEDAQAGTDEVDQITVGDRDLSLFIRKDDPSGSDFNAALGSWWYTTDSQGRAGWGNTRGNTGVGFMQLYDSDASTDTSLDMSFDNFDGTYYRDFTLSMTGENAGADDFARLSAIDNVNDAGEYKEYSINLTATGLQGEDSDNDGLVEALNTQPTGVTGSMTGIFQLTENETSAANQGFYTYDFTLSMTNWAWENRDDLMTQDDNGNPIEDTFAPSNFVAPAAAQVPLPATLALLGIGLLGVGVAARGVRSR